MDEDEDARDSEAADDDARRRDAPINAASRLHQINVTTLYCTDSFEESSYFVHGMAAAAAAAAAVAADAARSDAAASDPMLVPMLMLQWSWVMEMMQRTLILSHSLALSLWLHSCWCCVEMLSINKLGLNF